MTTKDSVAAPATSRRKQRIGMILLGLTVLAVCVVVRINWQPPPAAARDQALPSTAQNEPPRGPDEEHKLQVVAIVNGEQIGRNDLARESLDHYGPDVLEAMINKNLIVEACRQKNITVSNDEVGAEIDRMAERFNLSRDRWLKMLEDERDVSPIQYSRDIIWPSIALRKLAESRIQISDEDVQRAYETQFGPTVQVRIIVHSKLEQARKIYDLAVKTPSDFGNLAKQFSEDVNSASAKGLVQPIRRHMGNPKLEQVAFAMREGDISDVLAVDNQFVILKCDKHLPGRSVPMQEVHKLLVDACRDKKLRLVAGEVFEQLQHESHVENVYADPQKRQQYPGIAAIINDRRITILELAEECIERNGKQVLDGMINRRVIELACKARQIEITDADLDAEIARTAASMGKTKADGSPDIDAWLKEICDKQKVPLAIYRHDVVWPTVALKKMVVDQVKVSEEDLKKGFEANYGPRAKVRAIVFSSQRKAQEVWEMARNRPTIDYFGDLAEEYSVEASSRTLRGEVPPIQAHGGQPLLEKEAFALQPGELSSVLQVGERYVILLSEGVTKPIGVRFDEVRDLIHEDVMEKKVRLAMNKEFNHLQDNAQIDNFLAGTTQSPNKGKKAGDWSPGQSISRVPNSKTPDTLRHTK
ncbi:MAG TPA: peptidylprolyl isomerase [Pirellulales bacterium]|jgi:parvulin-like peptidyl-prolyl isomerase|nr:peptidylprolyl isomerase [Pirellulales bacterium]